MRVLFLSLYCRRRNRDRKIEKLAPGPGPSERQNWDLCLGSVASGYYAILLLPSKRINDSQHFHGARHYCMFFMYMSTFSLHKNSMRYAHFLFTPSDTLHPSILALCLERLTFGTAHFALWFLLVFGPFCSMVPACVWPMRVSRMRSEGRSKLRSWYLFP